MANIKNYLPLTPPITISITCSGDVYAKKEEDYLSYQAYVIAADAYIKQGLADKASVIYKKIGKLNMEKLLTPTGRRPCL